MADKITTTESLKEKEGIQPKPDAVETAEPGTQQFEANNPELQKTPEPEAVKESLSVKKQVVDKVKEVSGKAKGPGKTKIVALRSDSYDVGGNVGQIRAGQEYKVKPEVAEVLIGAGLAEEVDKKDK